MIVEKNKVDFEAAIFDMDGTLIDSMWIWEKIIFEFLDNHRCEYNIKIAEEIAYMTFEMSSAYIKENYGLDMSTDEIIAEWIAMSENYYRNLIKTKNGAKEYLEYLKGQGVKLAIATACPRYLCEQVLKLNDLEKYFDIIVYAEEVGKSKEHPDVYIETINKLGSKIEKCMLYEDISVALNTAHSIGLKTTIVEDASSEDDKEELMAKADVYIKDFYQLLGK